MAMMPARVKYRKMQRGARRGIASRGNAVAFGEYGLQALERCWMDTKQIEAARVAISRYMKRRGKMWIRIFPQKSFTKKPLETRMGTGKGEPEQSLEKEIRVLENVPDSAGTLSFQRETPHSNAVDSFKRFFAAVPKAVNIHFCARCNHGFRLPAHARIGRVIGKYDCPNAFTGEGRRNFKQVRTRERGPVINRR